jgi:glyoxylase-like metal-dependent hydrolase (beta-lactamase superfamily II)
LEKDSSTSGLQKFGENIWIIDGLPVRDMGVMFTTRMVVVRLSSGSLWVDSPVALPPDTLKRIADLGPVRYILAATPRHVWRLAAWHELFPEAELWAPRPTPFTLKKGDLHLAGVLGDEPYQAWANDFDQLAFKGNPLIEEVLFLHKPSRTVILDDLIQIHPRVKGRLFRNALFKLEGVEAPQGGVGLDIRLTFIHRTLARRSLEKLLSWDFDKLIIAHGPCIERNAKPFVERAFRWLDRPRRSNRASE